MALTLQAIASTTSKLRALLQDSWKDLERLQTLQTSLKESLGALFEANDDEENAEPPVVALAADDRLWKETVSLIATGRALGIAAQTEDAIAKESSNVRDRLWIADGKKYVQWLGEGVATVSVSKHNHNEHSHRAGAVLLGKALGIGYPDQLVAKVTESMVFDQRNEDGYFALFGALSPWEQRQYLMSLLPYLDTKASSKASSSVIREERAAGSEAVGGENKRIAGGAALLSGILQDRSTLQNALVDQLLARPFTIILTRICIAALPDDSKRTLLERNWTMFGDKLCIKHKPVAQQESTVRLLLLLAGRMHRSHPMDVFVLARSSHHGTAVSERLSSSSERIRWLGMIVATAVSRLVDKQDAKIDFGIDAISTEEAKWYLDLVNIQDEIGSIHDLVESSSANLIQVSTSVVKAVNGISKSTKATRTTTTSKIIEIISDDSDDDLRPYEKPDSDASDSEEDATLVDRKKPKAPVYIRTLLSMLSDNENYAAQQLALSTAASLIRRKADFGTELKDQAEDLALTLIGMQNTFDMDDWHEMRQAALVALVVAQPRIIGPWCANSFFSGDHSIAQRATLLTAMGLAGRELAGFGSENTALMRRHAEVEDGQKLFPTKQLPGRLHQIYGGEEGEAQSKEVEAISRQLEQTLLRPVATKQNKKQGTKLLRNNFSSLVADCFFFPLTGGWAAFSTIPKTARMALNNPTLLALLVKTLAILLSAAGYTSMNLMQMTSELWTMALSLSTRAMKHQPMTEGILFAMLAILDVSDSKRLVKEQATLLMESRNWVGEVWEKLEQDDGNLVSLSMGNPSKSENGREQQEVERCKYLAAGVLVKIKEITDDYQKMLTGNMAVN